MLNIAMPLAFDSVMCYVWHVAVSVKQADVFAVKR